MTLTEEQKQELLFYKIKVKIVFQIILVTYHSFHFDLVGLVRKSKFNP